MGMVEDSAANLASLDVAAGLAIVDDEATANLASLDVEAGLAALVDDETPTSKT